jgi:hypothetical protein
VSLRSIAVERMPAAVAADVAVDVGSNDDVLVAISSSQGIVQVWHFAPLSSFATSATASASQSPPKHHASPPRRGNAASLDDASPSSSDALLHPLLCGLHSIGTCAARDDLPVAFVRAAAGIGGAEDGMRVVAADASGTLSAFDVRTQCGGKGGIVDEVMMISSRGIHKQQQILPAVGHAAAVVSFELSPPCNITTLDAAGIIMVHSARTSSLTAASDGCDITRVDCFALRASVAIGSALPSNHSMTLSHRESGMFTGGSDGSLRAFDKDFICYWQARVCDSGITCMAFSCDSTVHIGCDNGRVMTFKFGRCAVGWSVALHCGRVQAIEATSQHTASLGDDGSAVLSDNDGITVYTLRCDAGWCGVKFTQARSLATVSCSGKLQLRSLSTLPPRAAESDVAWPCRLDIDVESGGGRCTAFDIIEATVGGGGAAVLAIGQVGADGNIPSDVTAVVVDLTFKVAVAKYRAPSAAITRIAFATGDWTLLPPIRHEGRGGARKTLHNDVSITEGVAGGVEASADDKRDGGADVGGIASWASVNAIVASCRDGTGGLVREQGVRVRTMHSLAFSNPPLAVHMWSPLLSHPPIMSACCGLDNLATSSSSNHAASRHGTAADVGTAVTVGKGIGTLDEKSNM